MWTQPVATALPDEAVTALLPLAKAHLRVTTNDEDALISGLIRTAVGHVEKMIGGYFVARPVTLIATAWVDLERLPTAPVQSVTEILFTPPGADVAETVPPVSYRPRLIGLEPSIVLAAGQHWPSITPGSDITVAITAGYEDATRPAELWQAALLLIAQWFRSRSATNVGNIVNELPNGVEALLCNHRRYLAA